MLIKFMLKLMYKKVLTVVVLLSSILVLIGCSTNKTDNEQVVVLKKGNVTYTSTGINEQLVKQAVGSSKFEIEQRNDAIVVIMPVKNSFNAKRPDVLLPSTLSPLTNIAKLAKQDKDTVIIIVGHSDNAGNAIANTDLSKKRAKSVSSVFSVAGLNAYHLFATGVGDNQPRRTNTTAKGREENKRVEIFIVQKQDRDLSTLPNLYAVTHYQHK